MSVRAVRFTATGAGDRIGRLEGDEIVDVGPADRRGFIPDQESWERVATAPRRTVFAHESVRLRSPVSPGKIVCFEMCSLSSPLNSSEGGLPTLLIASKFPSSVIASREPIMVPSQEPEVTFRPTLALIVGRRRRHPGESPLSSIGGYTAMNDVVGRQTLLRDGNQTQANGYDTFGPMGPSVVPASGIEWDEIELTARVNGGEAFALRIGDLAPSIAEVLDLLWPAVSLHPGDVVAVGARNSKTTKCLAHAGDLIALSVGSSGELLNPVLASRS